MNQPLVLHRLERLLVTVVHPETVADLPRLAVTVQALARDDLQRIRSTLDDTTAVPTS